MQKILFPHELFNLTEEQAADCLCRLAEFIIEKGKEKKSILDFFAEEYPEYCRLFCAYMVGFYEGLNNQYADPTWITYLYHMMNDLSNGRDDLAKNFIKYYDLENKFDLSESEILEVMKRMSHMNTVYPLMIIKEFKEEHRFFASWLLGYLDGTAAQYFDFRRVTKEMKFLAEIYDLCNKGKKEEIVFKLKRLKSDYEENSLRDVI